MKITDEKFMEQMNKFNERVREIPAELLEKSKVMLWAFGNNKLYATARDEALSICNKLINIEKDVSDAYKIEHMQSKHGGIWGEYPGYPISDWIYQVSNRETTQGYWVWVLGRIDSDGGEYDYRS